MNLSEAVVREDDSIDDLETKVILATILGTIQSTMTDFRYLRKVWKTNCDEERLLGVSLTGIMDSPLMNDPDPEHLDLLKRACIDTNKVWSDRWGVNQSTAITCVKPSGTVSKLVDSSSGIHSRFAPYYIQRIRNDVKDPITRFLVEQGVPYEEDVMNKDNYVFSFPMKSPDSARFSRDMSAIEQLDLWKKYQDHWSEHNPSCTIYYKEDEFLEVGSWVYQNFDSICGLSFMPYDDHVYPQAPWEAINEETYNEMLAKMPVIDWNKLPEYEDDDFTTGSQELACVGGACEI